MLPTTSRLLILGCSRRKLAEPAMLPAVERYDGPAFRLYRRFLRSSPSCRPVLYVFSAEFGLIAGGVLLPMYDRRMTRRRGQELREPVAARLRQLAGAGQLEEIFVNVGREYLATLGGEAGLSQSGARLHIACGTSGRRLAQLHAWLYGADTAFAVTNPAPIIRNLILRGVRISEDGAAALVSARRGLVEDPEGARRYQYWYVPVDGERVSPKWLVARLTGLPAGSFHSQEARRLLTRLGLEVRRG